MPADRYQSLRRDVATLQDRIDELEADLVQANEDLEAMVDANTDMEEENEGLRLEQVELEGELEQERAAREEAEAMCELLEERVSDELTMLRERVASLEAAAAEERSGRGGGVRAERTVPVRMDQEAENSSAAAPASRQGDDVEGEAQSAA